MIDFDWFYLLPSNEIKEQLDTMIFIGQIVIVWKEKPKRYGNEIRRAKMMILFDLIGSYYYKPIE